MHNAQGVMVLNYNYVHVLWEMTKYNSPTNSTKLQLIKYSYQ